MDCLPCLLGYLYSSHNQLMNKQLAVHWFYVHRWIQDDQRRCKTEKLSLAAIVFRSNLAFISFASESMVMRTCAAENGAINHTHYLLPWLWAAPPPQWPYQKCMWVLRLRCACVGGSEQAIASFSRPREPTLRDQSCMLLESDLLLNWESLRSQCQCSILWTSTSSPAWHAWSRDTQGLFDWRPMQATKQWQARHTGIRLQPTPTQYTQ